MSLKLGKRRERVNNEIFVTFESSRFVHFLSLPSRILKKKLYLKLYESNYTDHDKLMNNNYNVISQQNTMVISIYMIRMNLIKIDLINNLLFQ